MKLEPKEALTPEETEAGLGILVKQGLATQVKLTLTEGVFVVAFAILLGAPNTVVGILAATPSLAQLLQIPSVYLLRRFRSRRMLNFLTTLGSRITILMMALIPFVSTSETGLVLLVVLVAVQASFVAIGSPSWNSLLRDLVPEERLGSFFSRRMALMAAVAVVVSLLGGLFVSEWEHWNLGDPAYSFSALFFMAFSAGLISVYYITTLPEPKMAPIEKQATFSELISKPYQDDNFRNLMLFSGVWSFSTALAAPFFTVYLLTRLLMDLSFVTVLSAITQIMSILFFRFWGRLSDRFANKSVLLVTVPLFMVGTLLWTFSSVAESISIILPFLILIHIIMGVSAAGVNLTSGNIGLKLAPRGQAASYLAARGIIIAIAGAIAPLVGGLLADFFTGRHLFLTFNWEAPEGTIVFNTVDFSGLDFVFLISVVIGVYSHHRLALVKEVGEVKEKDVIDAILSETRRNVRTLSTIDGLRQTFQAPLTTVRKALQKKKEPQRTTFE